MVEDIRERNRRAVRASADLVARMSADDLGRPTPCAGWTMADLLEHMTAQHHGFAAAAEGDGGDPSRWALAPTSDDPVADYLASVEVVLDAFAAEGVLD